MGGWIDPREALRRAFALRGQFDGEPPVEGLGADPYGAQAPPDQLSAPIATEPESDWAPAPQAQPQANMPTLRSTAPSMQPEVPLDARALMDQLPQVPQPEAYARPQPITGGFRGHLKELGKSMIPGYAEGREQREWLDRKDVDRRNAYNLTEYQRQMQTLSPLLTHDLTASLEERSADAREAAARRLHPNQPEEWYYAQRYKLGMPKTPQENLGKLYVGKTAAGTQVYVRRSPKGGFMDEQTNEPVRGLTGVFEVGAEPRPQADRPDALFKQKLAEFETIMGRPASEAEKLRIMGASEPQGPQAPQESWGAPFEQFDPQTGRSLGMFRASNREPNSIVKVAEGTKQGLTSSTRQLGETASVLVPKMDATIKLLSDPRFEAKLGPAISRWNEFMAGTVGAGDPEFAALRSNIGLLQTGALRAHVGARGGAGMLAKFESLFNSDRMDVPTLRASLTAVRDFLKGYRDQVRGGGAGESGALKPNQYIHEGYVYETDKKGFGHPIRKAP